ncbi:MAG: Cell division protein FtsI [Peptidoglycan synthetase] (EC [uncultured Sulfurovum sp.]|uniref:Cell division protein FtsI [Peptidoglycan synthetase] (EC) n=1 Tax=uncultured Sulfurovum sp. TaxID=269237 RepID=A0A6S6STF0_9BACT|nr:MAG: Cell division protein FtsI [Peptidoglycan synthetase] (EC [uncultured Sulfurovum sp.]
MRFPIVITIFVLFWIMLVSRIYQISIKSNYYYENLAQMNIERKYFIKPVRGEILDRNGKLLAVNDIGFSIKIAPHLTRYDKEQKKRVPDEKLDKLITGIVNEFPDLNKTKLIKKYLKKDSSYNHRYIPVVEFIGYDEMIGAYPKLTINKSLKIESETKRLYPAGSMATHIVGYVGRSNLKENEKDPVVEKVGVIGKTGLERQYNQVLQGELGYRLVKVSAKNKEVAELEKVEPKDDQNLDLHIDLGLQKRINELFVGQAGIAVVMGVDGDIIAGVSYPSYDPNLFVGGISSKNWKELITDLDHPFTNKIIGGAYPPGSTIKMGMALAFSKSGTAVESTEYCKGYITLGKSKHKFRCWSRYGHGTVGLRKAIRESCDVYFYNKALQTGINAMAKSLRQMGLGVKTGVDLPRERSGIVPDKPWKRKRFNQGWYQGETVISSIGQGYNLATPLQVAAYTAFLATERLPTPQFVDVIAGTKVKKEYKTFEVNKQHLNTIRLGMYDVCNAQRGTARRTMSKLPIVVAGKTGTSQVVSIPQSEKVRMKESQMDYYSRSHAWLTTYAPYENPKYVVTVLIEHGGHGGSAAGPIAAEIYNWMANEGYFGEEFKGKIKLKDLTKEKKDDGHGH